MVYGEICLFLKKIFQQTNGLQTGLNGKCNGFLHNTKTQWHGMNERMIDRLIDWMNELIILIQWINEYLWFCGSVFENFIWLEHLPTTPKMSTNVCCFLFSIFWHVEISRSLPISVMLNYDRTVILVSFGQIKVFFVCCCFIIILGVWLCG